VIEMWPQPKPGESFTVRYKPIRGFTGQEMCETIAYVGRAFGIELTPEEIWRMNPNGEIWPVCDLFDRACAWLLADL
jgi:hypothetical protein